jgi:quercetin dioxygenase-like cupin family protein
MRLEKAQHTASAYFTFVLAVPEREVFQAHVEIAPGVAFGRHRHPGEEIVHVLEGSLEYQLEGQPPVTQKAGDVLFIPAGTNHTAKNVGGGNEAELATSSKGKRARRDSQ